MNGTNVLDERLVEDKRSAKAVMGDFLVEGLIGIVTIVLAIIGLSGYSPAAMLSIAVIIIGIAFLLEGGAISMRFPRVLAARRRESYNEELRTGVTAGFLGGLVGIILGILSLIGLSTLVLVSAAVIVYGSTLVLSSGTMLRFKLLSFEREPEVAKTNMAFEAVSSMLFAEFLFGLGTVILGIISLSGTLYPWTLVFTALLVLGFGGLLTAAVVTSKMAEIVRR